MSPGATAPESGDGRVAPATASPPDAWLDLDQAALLLRVARPQLAALVDDGILSGRLAPSGRPGLMKSDLLAWQRAEHARRHAALIAFAADIDREVFG